MSKFDILSVNLFLTIKTDDLLFENELTGRLRLLYPEVN